jgi:hypothetical protein
VEDEGEEVDEAPLVGGGGVFAVYVEVGDYGGDEGGFEGLAGEFGLHPLGFGGRDDVVAFAVEEVNGGGEVGEVAVGADAGHVLDVAGFDGGEFAASAFEGGVEEQFDFGGLVRGEAGKGSGFGEVIFVEVGAEDGADGGEIGFGDEVF